MVVIAVAYPQHSVLSEKKPALMRAGMDIERCYVS